MNTPVRSAALLVLLSGTVLGGSPSTETARDVPWTVLTARVFDPRWTLPETRAAPSAGPDEPPVDLRERFADLLARRFGADGDDPRVRSFGDAHRAVRALEKDAKGRNAFLARLRTERLPLWVEAGEEFEQTAQDQFLRSASWTPATDHFADGMLFGRPFRPDASRTAPWTRLDEPTVQQAAAMFFADATAILEAENDYAAYPAHVGSTYEWIHAVRGSHLRAKDPAGRVATALRVLFRSDLPFPYTTYDCDLRILHRVDSRGRIATDIYSTSADFHWLAGQDTLFPVETSDGEWTGTLVVRVFGFDMVGVPDGESEVREAIRSSLGNLKRGAEERFRRHVAAGGAPRHDPATVPDVAVTGVR